MEIIQASSVKKLREMTGLGMMDCKKALIDSNGDFEIAIENLRKQNKKIEKRASKETNQGIIASFVEEDGTFGIMLEINCESDFVARTSEFKAVVNLLLNRSVEADLHSKQELLEDLTARSYIDSAIIKTGENITIGRMVRLDMNRDNDA